MGIKSSVPYSFKNPNNLGISYNDGMLDITGASDVEIQIDEANNGKVIWVNVYGRCVLRICRIKGMIDINDKLNETKSETK